MDNDLDTFALALYVTADDFINAHPHLTPPRPITGIQPQITDAELITLVPNGVDWYCNSGAPDAQKTGTK